MASAHSGRSRSFQSSAGQRVSYAHSHLRKSSSPSTCALRCTACRDHARYAMWPASKTVPGEKSGTLTFSSALDRPSDGSHFAVKLVNVAHFLQRNDVLRCYEGYLGIRVGLGVSCSGQVGVLGPRSHLSCYMQRHIQSWSGR
ncbi:hypothetical protein RvY_00712 [Ramazzottius varieornatus]|uniref:Uncharacterized protein n=1 Tax=Ramazzottius varieornatus TaxID=947166 RepID=A0A1D1UE60_RAMVA|nr:hypothetical protein RvY_00712 [Ramazzottius varieornatus]